MSFYVPQDHYSSKLVYKPHLYSSISPLSPNPALTTYFEKFEKNYQTISNTRNINNFITDMKSITPTQSTQPQTRGKSLSTCYQAKRPQTSYKIYGTEIKESNKEEENAKHNNNREIYEKSLENNEYISIEKLLKKDNKKEFFIENNMKRPKSGKSCSTHLLSTQKYNNYTYESNTTSYQSPTYKTMKNERNRPESTNSNNEKYYNIYSQSNFTQREKVSKISTILKKIEGIQKNFDDHLFYKSMDYSNKITEETENNRNKQILKEAKNTENTPISNKIANNNHKTIFNKKALSYTSEELKNMKSKAFFEKENDYQEKTKNNEKLFTQIVNKRLEENVKKQVISTKFALFMNPDTPSKPCMTLDAIKNDIKVVNLAQNSTFVVNLPTKIDKNFIQRSLLLQKSKSPKFQSKIQLQSNFTTFTIEDFQIGKCLGKGRFGSVFLAKDKKSDMLVALKVIKKKTIKDSKMANQIKNEIKIQSCLSHPNVLKLYGFFQDEEQFYLILEYAPSGELYKKLKKQVFYILFLLYIYKFMYFLLDE